MATSVVRGSLRWASLSMALAACVGLVGCQVDVGGQTLPSPYWLNDDVQYFAPGTEFRLSREAAAMQAAEKDVGAAPAAPMPAPPNPAP